MKEKDVEPASSARSGAVFMTTFLKRKLSASRASTNIIKQLTAFSAAAPDLTMATFIVLRALAYALGTEDGAGAAESDMLDY